MSDTVALVAHDSKKTEANKYQTLKGSGMHALLGLLAVTTFVDDLSSAAGYFETAFTVDPLSSILVIVGQLIIAVSVLFFFYLTARGLLDRFIPESIGRAPPQDE